MFSVVLQHSGVYDKKGNIITTSVTTLDLHDIARSCRTYDVMNFYVVHPNPLMHELMGSIVSHWADGAGARINPDRKEAFKVLKPVYTLSEAIEDIKMRTGMEPYLVATTAKVHEDAVSIEELKKKVYKKYPMCIILGSGWGLSEEILGRADAIVSPIRPNAEYNHLSVRAAAAILLDRFFGDQGA